MGSQGVWPSLFLCLLFEALLKVCRLRIPLPPLPASLQPAPPSPVSQEPSLDSVRPWSSPSASPALSPTPQSTPTPTQDAAPRPPPRPASMRNLVSPNSSSTSPVSGTSSGESTPVSTSGSKKTSVSRQNSEDSVTPSWLSSPPSSSTSSLRTSVAPISSFNPPATSGLSTPPPNIGRSNSIAGFRPSTMGSGGAGIRTAGGRPVPTQSEPGQGLAVLRNHAPQDSTKRRSYVEEPVVTPSSLGTHNAFGDKLSFRKGGAAAAPGTNLN